MALEMRGQTPNFAIDHGDIQSSAGEIRSQSPDFVVGWSLGGLLALEEAIARPGEAAGLVLISSTARFTASGDGWPGTPGASLRALRRSLRKDPEDALRRFFGDCAAPHPLSPAEAEARIGAALAMGLDVLDAGLERLRSTDLRARLGEVRAPTFVIHGGEDRVIPPAAAERVAAAIPGAELAIIEGIGHDLPLRRSDLVAARIRSFLENHP
jgi:pimeloyl-[acyl-carrier protein] methyl ester esterase